MSIALALCAISPTVDAKDPPTASTVLIRVRGTIRIEATAFPGAPTEVTVLRDVEIGTGSGFVVSQDGYIVTNHHAVADDVIDIEQQGQKARLAIAIDRIEVALPPDSAAGLPQRYSASLVASDPELDLAVLYVSAPRLPVAALGDSDVVVSGDPVQALGYPLGDLLEVARTGRQDAAPAVSTSPGAISALRTDDQGELAYLQTTAALNPGNSGGPLVDQDGYVIGVVRMRVRGASGLGFAIPVDRVKRFLASVGIDHQLPVRSLDLGSVFAPPGKGLALQVPDGFQDEPRTRTRVDAAVGPVNLRIDRIASAWRAEQIEQVLMSGQVFEQLSWTRQARPPRPRVPEFTTGTATAVAGRDDEMAMEYALLEVGRERLVARYVGPADAIAFNRGTLRASLASLEADPLIARDFAGQQGAKWVPSAGFTTQPPSIPIPDGWLAEAGGAPQCQGLPAADSALTASPDDDFTVTFRAAWIPAAGLDAAAAAARCSSRRAGFGAASYAGATDWFGASYTIEGVFLQAGDGLLHLQHAAPVAKAAPTRDLFASWLTLLRR